MKLYQKYTLKWCRLFAHQNYNETACWNDMNIHRYWRVNKILTLIQHVESVSITEQNWFYPVDTRRNWTYIRRSEDIQDVFWTSYVRSIHVLRLLGPSKHINVESTLKQRWSSTLINAVSMLIFVWQWQLCRRTFIDIVSTLTKQRWSNVYRITLIQRRWTTVVSTLKFGWNWKLSWCMFVDVVSTLTK